ncbi:hypothetical protein [Limosilactobacillus sp.]|uniref:hypothetical protein n=1 Tax=Limosilactobacillus sp. TaxID=2773925 RepID=UPI003F07E55E
MADEVDMNGKFYKINTIINGSSDSYLVPGLNGRQGDDGRRVYLQFFDGNVTHDLTGEKVELQGKDAKGVTKTSVSLEHVYSAKAGTCSFLIPGAFYQAAGPYQTAYFVIKKADTDQAVSTIPVKMNVMENAVFMTTGESQTWFDEYNGQLKIYADMLKDWLNDSGSQIKANQASINAAQTAISDMFKQIQDNHLAKTTDSNTWTAANHFTGLTTIDNLSSPALDKQMSNMQNQFSQLSNSISKSLGAGLPKYTDFWSRDYTWGPNLSKPNNGNDFALSRFTLANNMAIIWGRGDVKVNHNGGDSFWESTLTIPWQVNSASFFISDWHTYKGYLKAYHPASNNTTVALSCSGNNFSNETIPVNLLIITQ